MKKLKEIFLLFFLFLLVSCNKKEPCLNYDRGELLLNNSTKEFVNFYYQVNEGAKIIYKNQDNEELEMSINILDFNTYFTTWNFNDTLSHDCIYRNGLSESGSIYLTNLENDFNIEIYIGHDIKHWNIMDFDYENVENIQISFFSDSIGKATQMIMLLEPIRDIVFSASIDTLNTQFENVFYENNNTFTDEFIISEDYIGEMKRYEVFYSKEFGLVGFKDWNEIFWKFDRVEY